MTTADTTSTQANEGRSNGSGRRGGSSRRKLTEEQEREVTRLYSQTNTPVPEISRQFGIGESSVYRVAQRHGASLRGRTSTSGQAEGGESGGASVGGNGRRRGAGRPPGSGRGRRGRAAASGEAEGGASTSTETPTRGRRGRAASSSSSSSSSSTTGATGTRGRRGRPPGSGRQAGAGQTSSGNGRRTRGRAAQAGRAASSGGSSGGGGGGGRQRYRVSFVGSHVVEASSVQEAIRAVEQRGATEITSVVREG